MEMRREVSRGKFILSSSHPLGKWLLNSSCVPGQLRCNGEQDGPGPWELTAHSRGDALSITMVT